MFVFMYCMSFIHYNNFIDNSIFDDHIVTSEKLLLVIETVPLDSGELMFVLLDYLL